MFNSINWWRFPLLKRTPCSKAIGRAPQINTDLVGRMKLHRNNKKHQWNKSVRPQRWSIFQKDGMFNVFFRPPLTAIVFQWFWQCCTITIECFLRAQPLLSMVFWWFSKFLRGMVNDGFEVNDGSGPIAPKKCVKSIYEKMQILSRTCKWTSVESVWYGPYRMTPDIM